MDYATAVDEFAYARANFAALAGKQADGAFAPYLEGGQRHRQREITSLAAQGLSNKEIADRLTMSTRSVEGRLFRASQRASQPTTATS